MIHWDWIVTLLLLMFFKWFIETLFSMMSYLSPAIIRFEKYIVTRYFPQASVIMDELFPDESGKDV